MARVNAGFFPRKRVANVTTTRLTGEIDTYTEERITQRSRIISLGIDARAQKYPDEQRFKYKPLTGHEEDNRWSEKTREAVLKDYNMLDMYI